MSIPTYDSFVTDEGLDRLAPYQVARLVRSVHISAFAGDIAVSDRYLAIRGGNLDYYAGLEYSYQRLVFTAKDFQVWALDATADECNAAELAERARDILAAEGGAA